MSEYVQLTDDKSVPITVPVASIRIVRPTQNMPSLTQACDVWIAGVPGHWRVRETYDEVRALLGIRS